MLRDIGSRFLEAERSNRGGKLSTCGVNTLIHAYDSRTKEEPLTRLQTSSSPVLDGINGQTASLSPHRADEIPLYI